MHRDSFERFYYEKVALGECCGCAEQVIRTRDLDALSRKTAMRNAFHSGKGDRFAWFNRLFRRRGNRQGPLKTGL